ncbi:hypothetical protein ACPB9E_04075 [Streptomyces exfoliatus]|uniref:hypothetical protein n=1 Tax=Streptomyces exfoliatus TaxID=1905 RepID=UPI003C2D72D9
MRQELRNPGAGEEIPVRGPHRRAVVVAPVQEMTGQQARACWDLPVQQDVHPVPERLGDRPAQLLPGQDGQRGSRQFLVRPPADAPVERERGLPPPRRVQGVEELPQRARRPGPLPLDRLVKTAARASDPHHAYDGRGPH